MSTGTRPTGGTTGRTLTREGIAQVTIDLAAAGRDWRRVRDRVGWDEDATHGEGGRADVALWVSRCGAVFVQDQSGRWAAWLHRDDERE